jgi:putative nucleotidyltransferase with HDIG domain
VTSPTPRDRARILVVDDDPAFGGMIAEVLRDKGHDTVLCASPDEALGKARESPFDTAVLDLMMPGMSGLDLADQLKAQHPDTQILILTGHGDMQSAIEGIQHGVFDYLQKASIDIPRLDRAVREATHRAHLLRDNRELLEQLRESNRLLNSLQDTTSRIGSEMHLDRLLTDLVASAKTLCNAACGRALLFDISSERVVVDQAFGDDAATLPGVRLSLSEGIATRAFDKNAAEVVLAPREDRQFSDRIDALPTPLPGLVCAPLRHGRVRGVLIVGGRRAGAFGPGDRDVLAVLARQAAIAVDNALEHERGINFFTHTSNMLVSFLEQLDVFYPGHSRAVARLADMVTRRLGLSDDERRNTHFAALLHDIGKLLVPIEILRSANYASEQDRRVLQSHPTLALEMLKHITVWEEILPLIHAHHERYDGKGYPLGISGESIPLGARVIAVADAFDAMTHRKGHAPARSAQEALAELEAFAGTQFDPKIVRLFVAEYRQNEPQG